MRLDFRILWIDDQPKHVVSFAEGIRRKLKDLGFHLDLVAAENLSKVEHYIGEHIHDDGIDLVLVDFDLGTGNGGEVALSAIRERFPYKDLIFYSATDTEKLRTIAFNSKIDGIHFSTRLSLVDDTSKVIGNLLRKTLDLDHMRGVVMSATSDIDYMVEKSLLAVYERLEDERKPDLLKKMIDSLKTKIERYQKDIEKAESKNTIESILKLKHLFTAFDRLSVLLEELKVWAVDSSSEYLDQGKIYQNDVIPRRNKLAHAMLRNIDGKQVLVGLETPITLEDMTRLRCDLIDHRINIENIAVLVDVSLD